MLSSGARGVMPVTRQQRICLTPVQGFCSALDLPLRNGLAGRSIIWATYVSGSPTQSNGCTNVLGWHVTVYPGVAASVLAPVMYSGEY